MQSEIDQVRQQTKTLPRPRIFCEEWGKPIIASQPWVRQMVEAAGGEFIGEPGKQISADEIRTLDPDVFIAAWCGAGDRVPLTKIVDTRNWQDLKAVREQRVFCIRDEYLNTPAPTLLQGLCSLAAALHPEHFTRPADLRCISDSSDDSPHGEPSATRIPPSRVG
jgi:iron complex transport system substrate-binding protein